MTEQSLKDKLRRQLKCDLEIVINENHSTMLNVLEKKRGMARLSMHKMFLDAPDTVITAIAHYIRRTRRDRAHHNVILRAYIQQNISRFDAYHTLDQTKLVQAGRVYHLSSLFDVLNQQYFEGRLTLALTWFGTGQRKNRSRILFGQYLDHMRLIKMNRILDDAFFPDYFVSFILYHEMVHAVVPGHVDEKGRYRVHNTAFRQQERVFADYDRAVAWERDNKQYFFKNLGYRRESDGRP